MTKKNKPTKEVSKTIEGGLSNYVVLKKEKEVLFYLENPYPTCLAIPAIMKERFSDDYKSIVTRDLDEFKKYRGQV